MGIDGTGVWVSIGVEVRGLAGVQDKGSISRFKMGFKIGVWSTGFNLEGWSAGFDLIGWVA